MSQIFEPAPLRPRGRHLDGAVLLGTLIVGFLAVALLKPWSWSEEQGLVGPSAAGSKGSAVAGSSASSGPSQPSLASRSGPPRLFAYPITLDVREALPVLRAQRAWGLAALVPGSLSPPAERGDVQPDFIAVKVGLLEDISLSTLGLDPRASHGPWVARPPLVLWTEGGAPILGLALTYPPAQTPRRVTTSLIDQGWACPTPTQGHEVGTCSWGARTPLGTFEQADMPAGMRLLLPPAFRNGRWIPDYWPPGRYVLELDLAGRVAELPVVVLSGPPWPTEELTQRISGMPARSLGCWICR